MARAIRSLVRFPVAAAVAWLGGLGTAAAAPVVLGPGTSFNDTGLDSAGTRTNVALQNGGFMPAGTYSVTSFSANIGQGGDVQPFVALISSGTAGSGNETYTVLAAGNDTTFSAVQTGIQTITFGNAAQSTFVVPAGGATVYAGISNVTGPNPVTTDNGGVAATLPGTDAHFNPGGLILPGQTLKEFNTVGGSGTNGGSNNAGTGPGVTNAYELNRRYDFSITVNSNVPEPASLGLIGVAAVGLLGRRRTGGAVRPLRARRGSYAPGEIDPPAGKGPIYPLDRRGDRHPYRVPLGATCVEI